MPKYRLLTEEELQLLEKDFIDFLIVNGITADDWVGIKEKDLDKAARFPELFSDVVFEKMMRKTFYLIKRIGKLLLSFHFDEDKATLFLVENWTIDKPYSDITLEDLRQDNLVLSKQTKAYQETRELELFNMIQGGAEVSDKTLYECISNYYIEVAN